MTDNTSPFDQKRAAILLVIIIYVSGALTGAGLLALLLAVL